MPCNAYTHTDTDTHARTHTQELQQRDAELVEAGAQTEHIHDTMLRLRAIAEVCFDGCMHGACLEGGREGGRKGGTPACTRALNPHARTHAYGTHTENVWVQQECVYPYTYAH